MSERTYVTAPNGRVAHILTGKKIEGEKLLCGLRMGLHWYWLMTQRRHVLPTCKRCETAGG